MGRGGGSAGVPRARAETPRERSAEDRAQRGIVMNMKDWIVFLDRFLELSDYPILLDNGIIVQGSNQENAAYPSGLCAERVAIFYAGANYPDAKVLKIAISATSDISPNTTPIPPCGACRQSIAEYEQNQENLIEIYFMGERGQIYQSESLKNLLPFSFDKHFL